MLRKAGFILIICLILLYSSSVYASDNINKPMIKITSFKQITGAASKLQNPSQKEMITPEKRKKIFFQTRKQLLKPAL